MARLSTILFALLNVVLLLIGSFVLCVGIDFMVKDDSACRAGLRGPLMITGAVMTSISLIGLVGAYCRMRSLLGLYKLVIIVLALGVCCFTVLTVSVTNKEVAKWCDRVGRLAHFNYKSWVRKIFAGQKRWEQARSCLVSYKFCRNIGGPELHRRSRSHRFLPLQVGCCEPPASCGFEFQNGTWAHPRKGAIPSANDCTKWSSDPTILCYNCEACKAGFASYIKNHWLCFFIFNISLVVVLIIVVKFTAYVSRSAKKDEKFRQKQAPLMP